MALQGGANGFACVWSIFLKCRKGTEQSLSVVIVMLLRKWC